MAIKSWILIGATVADLVANDTFTIDEYCVGQFMLSNEVLFMANAEKWQIARKPSVKWTVADFERIDETSELIARKLWTSYWEEYFDANPGSNIDVSPCPTLPRYRLGDNVQHLNLEYFDYEPPF
jgi:hypothetical protein